MTAEIAILNRNGIALAADSAVSIGVSAQPKIYNTGNKLFSLSKRAPVGAMIYGNVLLTGTPWETVIKSFRQKLGAEVFETVVEYAEALIDYIEETPALFSASQEQSEFELHCIGLYEYLQRQIVDRLHSLFEAGGQATDAGVSTVVAEVLQEELRNIGDKESLENLPEGYGDDLVRRFSETEELAKRQVFEQLPLVDEATRLLRSLTIAWMERPLEAAISGTGLVVAGFGESEFVPALIELQVYGVMGGSLRRRTPDEHRISANNNAAVLPFAQREMVDLFMSGIDPELREVVDSTLLDLTDSLAGLLADAIPVTESASLESLRSGGTELFETYHSYLRDYIQHFHIAPILDAVSVLPIDELGAMAETLVNLTSFKRRVTLDAETVGGPIDVAVISKGDGLVWIRRKHYFDPTLNHHFFANYFRYGSFKEQGEL